jgi:hypothetical protein
MFPKNQFTFQSLRAVGKATGCTTDGSSRLALRVHLASYLMDMGVNRPESEADQSPTSTKVQKTWVYTYTPPIRVLGVVLN